MGKARTFVVAGATGRQGSATARHLINSRNRVIGITHTPTKAPRLESMGVIPLVADLRDSSTLMLHLKEIDGFFLVTDPFAKSKETGDIDDWVADELRQGEQALEAAWDAKVPHVVLGSVSLAAQAKGLAIHKTKIKIEKHAREFGLSYTALRPPFFMEDWVPNSGFPTPWTENGRFEASVKSDTPIPHIATDDVGRIAAWSFDHPDESRA